jgi:hypothetical protein
LRLDKGRDGVDWSSSGAIPKAGENQAGWT